MTSGLSSLAKPEIIEVLDFEEILTELIADANDRFVSRGIDYDVGGLEVDPVKIVLEAAAAREVRMRARINDAARANLVYFATGSDLDHLAAFYDVTRLPSEGDTALRSRVILAIKGRSPGGSEYWYESKAREADSRIRDVAVYREEFLPIIHVAVLSSVDGGVPDAPMLQAVTDLVTSTEVRLINDKIIIVESAVSQTLDITAQVWLLPDAPATVVQNLEQILRDAWEAEAGIGFDLDRSWIEARLHVAGVKRVELTQPLTNIVATPNEALALGTITIENMGRAY